MANLQFNSGVTGRAASLSYRFFTVSGAWDGAAVTANINEVASTGVYVASSVTIPATAMGVYWADSGLATNFGAEQLMSDTQVAATRLLTAIELDGSVYRFTTNALELAPGTSVASILNTAPSGVASTLSLASLIRLMLNRKSQSGDVLTVHSEVDDSSLFTISLTTTDQHDAAPVTATGLAT